MLERRINKSRYSFNEKIDEITINNNLVIKLDQIWDVETSQFIGIYVCSCSPERNKISTIGCEDFPTPCEHIKKLREDKYLDYVIKMLYKECKTREAKGNFGMLWAEKLEGKELSYLVGLRLEGKR